jgi:hypothetical protein
MSLLIQRLEHELSVATDRQCRAELFARKACGLARLGRFEEAAELITALRANFGDWSSGRIHVWIMVAEGLLSWYTDLSPAALDRILRAQVLSVAMRYEVGIAISSAWKAHIEFERSDFDSMFRSLKIACAATDEKNNDANARIAIVLCNTLSYCGEWVGAQDWFMRGRKCALDDGDQASIEALQYNRAALAITWIRAEHFAGIANRDSIRLARSELDSARNLQRLTKIGTLTNHLALCDARLHALEGRYEPAAQLLADARSGVPFAHYHFSNNLIDLEIAYCHFKTGDVNGAIARVRAADLSDFFELDIDDRLIAVCMLCEMSASSAEFGQSSTLNAAREELRAAYFNLRDNLKVGVHDFLSDSVR